MVVGNFGEINKEFKQFISSTALLAGQTKDAANMTPANWIDVGNLDATKLIQKRFKVALGCMAAVRAQNELLIKRLQFIRNSPVAATQVTTAGPPRGYFYEYGNSTFNDRGSADAYNNFWSYNNSYRYEGEDDE